MTDARDRQATVRTILDQHNELARHMRRSSDAFDRLLELMRQAVTEIHDANDAQREAIDAMIAANTAAIALIDDEPHP